ncbi:GNAT family N-acetyltransferase [Microbacterium sp. A204]|uniref:GNAT family N-acetyltransferase n=1 Tax=Microbacterium sp. A204 TaxID=3457321 RepID=UPI003FD33844
MNNIVKVIVAGSEDWQLVRSAFGSRGTRPTSCWCQRFIGAPPDGDKESALRHQIHENKPPFGLVALIDDDPVGWSRVSRRLDLPGVRANTALQRVLPPDPFAWWVACFTVQATFRHRGVGRALLSGAIEHARVNGASALEGHPVDVQRLSASKVSGAALFTGTLATFQDAGFSEIGRTFPSRPVMRLSFEEQPGPAE